MRVGRRGREGRWSLLERDGQVWRLVSSAWTADEDGHWPWVEFQVRELGAGDACPACGRPWQVEEMDCIFGDARRSGNDLLLLLHCVKCRVPFRARLVGFLTAYPGLLEKMEGWTPWVRREAHTRKEERVRYGRSADDPEGPEVEDPEP